MIRISIPTLTLALTGTLALAACGDAGVQTADNRIDVPETTAANDPLPREDTRDLQDDTLQGNDNDVRTMGNVNDPYDTGVRDNNDPLEEAGEEIEQEIDEAERDLQQ